MDLAFLSLGAALLVVGVALVRSAEPIAEGYAVGATEAARSPATYRQPGARRSSPRLIGGSRLRRASAPRPRALDRLRILSACRRS